MTIRKLLVGLAVLIVFAGLLSAWLAQRLIAAPLIKVVNEIRHVERFDLDRVQRHPSRLAEIENLSGAIGDMAQGLAAFRKYIPADLVKRLISDGNGARLGGAVRPMSVMFIDLAGFTGMSERLGDRIIPLLSRYFDSVSAQIQNQNGTIDKFIGDTMMAFWGVADPITPWIVAAPRRQRAVRRPSRRRPRPARQVASASIPATCWSAISDRIRLNYTVIGDAVNVQPAGEHQQGIWLHDHHRPGNAPAGGGSHRGSRTRQAGGLRPRRRIADLRIAGNDRRVRRQARMGGRL
jgi:adenylate cyclase